MKEGEIKAMTKFSQQMLDDIVKRVYIHIPLG